MSVFFALVALLFNLHMSHLPYSGRALYVSKHGNDVSNYLSLNKKRIIANGKNDFKGVSIFQTRENWIDIFPKSPLDRGIISRFHIRRNLPNGGIWRGPRTTILFGDGDLAISNYKGSKGLAGIFKAKGYSKTTIVNQPAYMTDIDYLGPNKRFRRVGAPPSLSGRFFSEFGGSYRRRHSDSTQDQAKPPYSDLLRSRIRGLPLSTQIAIAAILAIGATGVGAVGAIRVWDASSRRVTLIRAGGYSLAAFFLGASYAIWWAWAFG